MTLLAVAKGLERLGFDVTRCSESGKGVELALRGSWDLIVLDVDLPSPVAGSDLGFDGLKLLRWMRLAKNRTPVVLFTGSPDFTLEQRALAAGAIAVVRKSEPPGRLFETIRQALEPVPEDLSVVAFARRAESPPSPSKARFRLSSLGRLFGQARG